MTTTTPAEPMRYGLRLSRPPAGRWTVRIVADTRGRFKTLKGARARARRIAAEVWPALRIEEER